MEVEEVVTKTVERTDISASSSDAAKIQKKKTTKSREEEPSKPLETPEKESSKSPEKEYCKSPEKESSKSPEKESSKSPEKESPKSPEKESSKSPEKESSKSPEKESSKSPEKESYKYPKKIPSTSPEKVPTKRVTRSMTRQASEVDTKKEDDDDDDDDYDDYEEDEEPEDSTNTKKTTGLGKGIKRKRGPPRANNSTAFEASWNETDKKRLLIALQRFGILEIDQLIKSVPGKNEKEIRKFISLKWRAARTELRTHIREVRRSKGDSSSYLGPVDHWLEILASHYPNYDHYKTNPIAHAILLIWKYEKHPDPSECGGVDFKALYEYLYYTLCGYPPKHLNPPTASYLAESLKKFVGKIKHGEWSDILMHMKTPLKLKTPTRTTVSEDDVIAALSYSKEKCLEELANLSGYNPFSIPINLLKRGMRDGK